MKFSPCENCNQLFPGQYVHDSRSGDVICTRCGCVARKRRFAYLHVGAFSHQHNPVFTTRPVADNRHRGGPIRTLIRAPLSDRRDTQRERLLAQYGDELDLCERVRARAASILSRYLKTRTPIPETVAAAIVVARRALGLFANTRATATELGLKDLGPHVAAVARAARLSIRSDVLGAIPLLVQQMGFPVSFERHLRAHYTAAARANANIGANTLMALVLVRFYTANRARSTLRDPLKVPEDMADMTDTSAVSMRAYMSGARRCSLFKVKPAEVGAREPPPAAAPPAVPGRDVVVDGG